MKKLLLSIIIFTCAALSINAQAVYSSADTVWISGPNKANDNDFSDLEHGFVFKNVSALSDSFRWVRTINNLPSNEWESAVCDINLCYPSDVDSADFLMVLGDSGIFYPHFYPGKGIGIAEMIIDIFNVNNRNQKVTIVVYAEAWDAYNSITTVRGVTDLIIYPNPVSAGTKIRVQGKQSGNITVKNIEGKALLNTYISSQNREIETQTLSQGIYFIEINDGHSVSVSKLIIN
ncbi:MAG: T9SS type A sorting domain-containing protein [Bacteroidia bacterium]|nr:T9SS type A sorting domain-containing protein [Bacteroidia bacterium]